MPLTPADERLFEDAYRILSLERQYTFFQMYSMKGNVFSQCDIGYPYTTFALWVQHRPSPQEYTPQLCSDGSCALPNLRVWAPPADAKDLQRSETLAHQSVMQRDFHLVRTQCCIPSTSLSLPFLSPWKSSISLPQFTSKPLASATLSPFNCRVPSPSL